MGNVALHFTWPVPEGWRDGHKMFCMPTTMSRTLSGDSGGDAWIYIHDSCMATSEGLLPRDDDDGSDLGGLQRPATPTPMAAWISPMPWQRSGSCFSEARRAFPAAMGAPCMRRI